MEFHFYQYSTDASNYRMKLELLLDEDLTQHCTYIMYHQNCMQWKIYSIFDHAIIRKLLERNVVKKNNLNYVDDTTRIISFSYGIELSCFGNIEIYDTVHKLEHEQSRLSLINV